MWARRKFGSCKFSGHHQAVFELNALAEGRYWFLRDRLRWEVSGYWILIPEGFVTDMASIPRPLWSILPKWDNYGPAAIGHDWLYYNQLTTRKVADQWMRSSMEGLNVNKPKQLVIYWTLRAFGGVAWDRNARRKKMVFIHVCRWIASMTSS